MELNVFKIKQNVANDEFNNFINAISKARGINAEDVQRLLTHNIITIDALAYLVDKSRSNVTRFCYVKTTARGKLIDPFLKRVEDIWLIPKEGDREEKPGPLFIEINDNCIEYIRKNLGI